MEKKGGERQKSPQVLFHSESGAGVVRFPRRGLELGRRRGREGGRKGREGKKRLGGRKGKEGEREKLKRRLCHKQRLGLIQFCGPEIQGKKIHN